jgi:hypothetical protein
MEQIVMNEKEKTMALLLANLHDGTINDDGLKKLFNDSISLVSVFKKLNNYMDTEDEKSKSILYSFVGKLSKINVSDRSAILDVIPIMLKVPQSENSDISKTDSYNFRRGYKLIQKEGLEKEFRRISVELHRKNVLDKLIELCNKQN